MAGMTRDERSNRVVWALRRAFQAVESQKEQRLRATGLAGAHYSVMVNVGAYPGITGAELSRRLNVTAQNVAGLVVKLEQRGLLDRRIHPAHRNVLELHLTKAGRRALDQADAVVTALEADVVELLGPDLSAALRDGLDRIARDLSDAGAGPAA